MGDSARKAFDLDLFCVCVLPCRFSSREGDSDSLYRWRAAEQSTLGILQHHRGSGLSAGEDDGPGGFHVSGPLAVNLTILAVAPTA